MFPNLEKVAHTDDWSNSNCDCNKNLIILVSKPEETLLKLCFTKLMSNSRNFDLFVQNKTEIELFNKILKKNNTKTFSLSLIIFYLTRYLISFIEVVKLILHKENISILDSC